MRHPTLIDTIALVRQAHSGQTDKAGKPYWLHPLAVMTRLPRDAGETTMHMALLHDVIEDTSIDEAQLRQLGYGDEIIDGVVLLSRNRSGTRDEPYLDWIRRLGEEAPLNVLYVKLADLSHNSDLERVATLPEVKPERQQRYQAAKVMLKAALQRRFSD